MNSNQKLLILVFIGLIFNCCKKSQSINEPGSLVPKTVDQNLSLPSINVKGIQLHSEAIGPIDSSLIICLHSGPGGDYRHLLNCSDLAKYGFRVVFYDQRGSGLSQRLSESSYNESGLTILDSLYDEVSGVISHYKTSQNQKVFLLGLSWGGMLATGYASKHPDSIQGLIVCEPGGLKWEDIKEYTSKSRSFNLWSESLNDITYLDQFLSGKENQQEILDYKMALNASKNEITGENNTLPGSFWRYGALINAALFKIGMSNHPDFSEHINNFNKSVLFYYSEKNKAYSDDWAYKISRAYNTVNLIKISGVAHDGIISDKTAWTQQTLPQLLIYLKSH